jgi:hypothetical protein
LSILRDVVDRDDRLPSIEPGAVREDPLELV